MSIPVRLAEPPDWTIRRELVTNLVERVRVDTRQRGDEREACITVTYRFSAQEPALECGSADTLPARVPKLELKIKNRAGRRKHTHLALLAATA